MAGLRNRGSCELQLEVHGNPVDSGKSYREQRVLIFSWKSDTLKKAVIYYIYIQ